MLRRSPWLDFARPTWPALVKDFTSDIAVVGGGISGVVTLFYLLNKTQQNVVLLEKNRIASGATGHNAGLAVSHIEKPASEIADLIGLEATHALFAELDAAWEDLHNIHEQIGLKDNLIDFPSAVNGFTSLANFFSFLRDALIRDAGGRNYWQFLVSEELKENFPHDFLSVVEFVPRETILASLKTIDVSYVAAMIRTSPFLGKRMNSAKFCYKVLDYLQKKFPERFAVYEETEIVRINLESKHSLLLHSQGTVRTKKVILCTNAYKNFTIWHEGKPFTKLHEAITPRIGYLAAFPNAKLERYALGFVNQEEECKEIPFWYFSHAPHFSHNIAHSCVIGGPEFDRDDTYCQEWEKTKSELSINLIQDFLKKTFKEPPEVLSYFWHGWMGYTKNGLRWVGPDPDHPQLWYNLACNGIGIVPAVAGAKKIAQQLNAC